MASPRLDPYAVLGLTPSATQGQIRHAYLGLLRQHHPDTRAAGDAVAAAASTAHLQDALAAYAVLGDPERRAHYDQRPTPSTGASRQTRPEPAPRDGDAHRPPILAGPVLWQPSHPWVRRPAQPGRHR